MKTPLSRAEAARKGGLGCLAKHGREHFRQLGKAGFRSTVARHWQGDAAGYLAHLRRLGRLALVEAAADAWLDRQIQAGDRFACVELDDPLDDLPF